MAEERKKGESDLIVQSFRKLISENMAVPVAAMSSLNLLIKESKANTWMELDQELRYYIDVLKKSCNNDDLGGRTNISLGSGCELFMKYVSRAFNIEDMDFDMCKEELLRRGKNLAGMSLSARAKIADWGHSFIADESTVLVHGSSRVVTSLILRAAQTKAFNIIMTEGKPVSEHFDCFKHARQYAEAGIPVNFIMDSAVGAAMERVDICIMGAEGVSENGGIVNKIGTYQIALCAKALNKPFYVAVESYKFARMYPLSQRDIQTLGGAHGSQPSTIRDVRRSSLRHDVNVPTSEGNKVPIQLSVQRPGDEPAVVEDDERQDDSNDSKKSPSKMSSVFEAVSEEEKAEALPLGSSAIGDVTFELPTIDFTPANLITLLFTDLGVLTPAAVSDELIRLYQ